MKILDTNQLEKENLENEKVTKHLKYLHQDACMTGLRRHRRIPLG